MSQQNVLITSVLSGQRVREILDRKGIFDKRRRLKKLPNGRIAIPIAFQEGFDIQSVVNDLGNDDISVEIGSESVPLSKSSLVKSPYSCMVAAIKDFFEKISVCLSKDIEEDIPTHWERHSDLILFPENVFIKDIWRGFGEDLWKIVAKSLGCTRLAKKGAISTDGYRTPRVVMLYGTDGWVQHTDNNIRYSYNITKCMFSAGNITEKLRIASFDCTGETVVDLYAGIGYFTLPYLVHAKAAHVHACEWNPDAVKALSRNLELNHVSDRCTIHPGDNRKVHLKDEADRVNLGLIPSSKDGWIVACTALKSTGGFLHIHSNVTSKPSADSDKICGEKYNLEEDSYCHKTSQFPVCNGKLNRDLTHSGCDNEDGNYHGISHSVPNSGILLSNTAGNEQMESNKVFWENLENVTVEWSSPQIHGSRISQRNKKDWLIWAESVAVEIADICSQVQNGGLKWHSRIVHIEHVKSYAPHIDHLVLDLECRPLTGE